MKTPLITSRTDWSEPLLHEIWEHIEDIALNDLKLDYYQPQIEIISAEQMIDAYSSVGMPVHYNHWSFGKGFLKDWNKYQKGKMGLAYEIVSNSNPCISYLMEENNAITQALVMAHAACGHAHVFKNNYLFKEWTSAGSIIDYMIFAKNYIRECEEKYGEDEVEKVLDAAHSIAAHGVDKRKRKHKKRMSEEERAAEVVRRANEEQQNLDIIMKRMKIEEDKKEEKDQDLDMVGDEENLIYFIYKNAPNMEQWKREILRIVYKVQQYFYPQGQCLAGNHLVATPRGLVRLDKLITKNGFNEINPGLMLLTDGDRFTHVSHTYKKKAKAIRITTLNGREFIATPEHPLMMLNGVKQELKKVGESQIGNYIVVNLGYEKMFSQSPFPLTIPILNPTSISKSVNIVKMPEMVTENAARLFGYLRASSMAHLDQPASTVSLRAHMLLLEDFKNLLKSELLVDVDIHEDDFGSIITFSSYTLKQFLEANSLHNDQFKSKYDVPQCILASPSSVVASYLRSVFDVNCIRRTSMSNFEILGYDSDKEALQHIQTLCTGLGISSRISKMTRLTYAGIANTLGIAEHSAADCEVVCLKINPEFAVNFANTIGSISEKNIRPNDFSKSEYVRELPGGKALIEKVFAFVKATRIEYAATANTIANRSHAVKVKQDLLLKNSNLPALGELPVIRGKELTALDLKTQADKFSVLFSIACHETEQLRILLSESDSVVFDKIVSIEDVGDIDVYDVTIPENHLFWVDGVISHNTKVLNEGFATHTHFYIMNELEKRGVISPDAMIAALHLHSNVIYQPPYTSRYYSGFNPYSLGFSIFKEIRRICESPTAEDKEWFPSLVGKDWREAQKEAAAEYRDESFIEQFLSPALIRELRLFSVYNDGDVGLVTDISDAEGYAQLRRDLSSTYNRINSLPEIVVHSARMKKDRTLSLEYKPFRERTLNVTYATRTLEHVRYLWGYDVELVQDDNGKMFPLMRK